MFINCWNFIQGADFKDLNFLQKFAYFKGLHIFQSNFPEAAFVQGATSIPDFRIILKAVFSCFLGQRKVFFNKIYIVYVAAIMPRLTV